MGYDKLIGLRDLFEKDTGLLNPTQRLILILMVEIEGTEGFFLDFERYRSMTGLKKRALLQNLHLLRDGKFYKDGFYSPCPNLEHKHLNIIKTERYAKAGASQTYRTDLTAYETLISVHLSAPTNTLNQTTSVHLETESVHLEVIKGAPTSQLGSTPVHPYIQDIQDIQDIQEHESFAVKLQVFLNKKLPNEKRFTLSTDLNRLCGELERKGTSFKALETALSPVGEGSIHSPKAFVKSRLEDLMTREPDWSADNKPKWCGTCDERTRRNSFLSAVPGGDGAMTYSCPKCEPYMVRKKADLNY
jgi:hypothetical protein